MSATPLCRNCTICALQSKQHEVTKLSSKCYEYPHHIINLKLNVCFTASTWRQIQTFTFRPLEILSQIFSIQLFVEKSCVYFLCHHFFRVNSHFFCFAWPWRQQLWPPIAYSKQTNLFCFFQCEQDDEGWTIPLCPSSATSVLTTDGQRCMWYPRGHLTCNLYLSIFKSQHMQKKCWTKRHCLGTKTW